MKNLLVTISLLVSVPNFAQNNWLECENKDYRVVVSDFEGAVFPEDHGMDGFENVVTMTFNDKLTGETLVFTNVLKTYNEFNEYTADALLYHPQEGYYTGVSLEFNSEEVDMATFSADLMSRRVEGELTCTMVY